LQDKRNNYYIIIIYTESSDYSLLQKEPLSSDIKHLLIDAAYLPLSFLFVVDKSNNEDYDEIKQSEYKGYNHPTLRLNFELLYLEGDDLSKEIEKFSFALGNLTNHIEQYYSLNREMSTP